MIIISQKKTFQTNAKICRDDYAKKYSNKVYIGMAVCKGRGDDIKHKVKHTHFQGPDSNWKEV